MSRVSLQCSRMAAAVVEYCEMIDSIGGSSHKDSWLRQMGKLLPRLHIAVIALVPSREVYDLYQFPDDDQRCELYMWLNHVLQSDRTLNLTYGKSHLHQQSCERLADDFTDIYFDLKLGLELLEVDPNKAVNMWQCSFYVHWGLHLLDAECHLNAVESGEKPLQLSGWRWPNLSFAGAL